MKANCFRCEQVTKAHRLENAFTCGRVETDTCQSAEPFSIVLLRTIGVNTPEWTGKMMRKRLRGREYFATFSTK